MNLKTFILIVFLALLFVLVGLRAEIAHTRIHRLLAKQGYEIACLQQGESPRECSFRAIRYAKGLK